jgi:signal transduction histidine kinase
VAVKVRQPLKGLAIGAVGIALVSAAIAVLKRSIEPDALTGLYLFAILPVAILAGFWVAAVIAIASVVTFAYFFIPPLHSFEVAHGDTLTALTIAVVAAYLVSDLARRAHERAAEAGRLAEEQAALRRVATLVARDVPTSEVFDAVTREVGQLFGADLARMERFEPDGTVTALAAWSRSGDARLAVGTRIELEGTSIAAQVRETGRPARVDSFAGATGPIAREAQELGIRSSVGSPIVVGGRVWGVIAASTRRDTPFPPDTEARIGNFTELIGTAVSNAEARAQIVASRARLVTAGDEARRRVVRNLHDGAQQRLVHTIITLKLARRAQEGEDESANELVAEALASAEQANVELRELVHGLLPSVLSRGGLSAGVEALVERVRVPVEVDVTTERFAPEIEASAYFVVAEALTNLAKHSGAQHASVAARVDDGMLHVEVRDDGIGGARPEGSGLLGLSDRLAALGGHLRVESPPGHGTRIAAALPLHSATRPTEPPSG